MPRHFFLLFVGIGLTLLFSKPARAQGSIGYEHEPILYSNSEANNRITRLQAAIDAGKVHIKGDDPKIYLRSLLSELQIPISSQMLVFSHTSLQHDKVSPKTPRAIYFNDEVHLGFVQGGKRELAVADPLLGMVFYTQEPVPAGNPQFQRQNNSCLNCHGGLRTRYVPGLQVRSVFADPEGKVIIAAGSFRTDHTSPLEQRWGGWYVTGTHGKQKHLGNFIQPGSQKPKSLDNPAGQNVTDLSSRLDVKPYLSPHSDLIALMVFEHQTDTYNFITRANFETRIALNAKKSPEEAARKAIEVAGEALVRKLLFSTEAKLDGPLAGTSAFAKEFPQRGPRDKRGRSLRDLDLERRLFKYPCSYLIYSPAFDALPRPMRDYVERRLWEVLTGKDTSTDFAHLAAADRQAIFEILRDTRKMPEFWR